MKVASKGKRFEPRLADSAEDINGSWVLLGEHKEEDVPNGYPTYDAALAAGLSDLIQMFEESIKYSADKNVSWEDLKNGFKEIFSGGFYIAEVSTKVLLPSEEEMAGCIKTLNEVE